jgi:hypothetical protein
MLVKLQGGYAHFGFSILHHMNQSVGFTVLHYVPECIRVEYCFPGGEEERCILKNRDPQCVLFDFGMLTFLIIYGRKGE